jgi:hypothetical protein
MVTALVESGKTWIEQSTGLLSLQIICAHSRVKVIL